MMGGGADRQDGGEAVPGDPAGALECFVAGEVGTCSERCGFYTQALKALSERSPFDSNGVLATTVPILASLLSKHADSRKKHKRHLSDTKSNRKGSTETSKSSNVWIKDDGFRELTFQDIERLHRSSSSFSSSSSNVDSSFSSSDAHWYQSIVCSSCNKR